MSAKPRIACLANGPYSLNEPQARPVDYLQRSDGSACATARGVSLCRCGGSKKKPFCDGTHRSNGFSDKKSADAPRSQRIAFRGKGITIFDDRSICAHAGFCTDGLKSVFRMGQEPWIDADGASVQEAVATIRKCPSGALSYEMGGAAAPEPERPPMVTVTDNGPYAITGGVELAGVPMAEGASREHYTLCRCGASKNKPFCDGSHWGVQFRDP